MDFTVVPDDSGSIVLTLEDRKQMVKLLNIIQSEIISLGAEVARLKAENKELQERLDEAYNELINRSGRG